MNLNSLTEKTSTILKTLYSLEVVTQIDWHPALERQGTFYQTSICDCLSDTLRIAPASIARSVQKNLSDFGLIVETDNRGFIFVEASQFDLCEQIKTVDSVLLFIQPPATANLSLYYCKFLSQVAIQLEMLNMQKLAAKIYIPQGLDSGESSLLIQAQQFYGKDGFKQLLELLRLRHHKPSVEDLVGFENCAFDVNLSQSFLSENLVMWLSSELLSVPAVAEALFSIRRKLNQSKALIVRTTRLDPVGPQSIYYDFLSAFESNGLPLLVYLAQLEHALDLDWQNPTLDNWLSLNWLLKSLENRKLLMPEDTGGDSILLTSEELRAKFLLLNLSYMQQRAASFGDSLGFLHTLRQVSEMQHRFINMGQFATVHLLNNVASFPPNMSSIIARF